MNSGAAEPEPIDIHKNNGLTELEAGSYVFMDTEIGLSGVKTVTASIRIFLGR